MNSSFKILATSYDFSPNVGGISNCAQSILTAMAAEKTPDLRLIAREDAGPVPFPLVRVRHWTKTWLAALQFTVALRREVKRRRPDAVLHFLWWPEAFSSYLRSLFSKCPVPYFIFVHGMEILESDSSWRSKLRARFAFLKRMIFSRAAGVIAVSDYAAKLVSAETGIAQSRIKTIYHGVDPRRFSPGNPSPELIDRWALGGKKVFLTVSRLDSYKGIDHMILAMKKALLRFPDLVYLVVGSGGDETRLQALIKVHGLKRQVKLVGRVSDLELPDYYRASDCYVLLSREHWDEPNVEGFGISILEAAGCGKPALVGKKGGMEEAISFGKGGWAVDASSVDAVAVAIQEIAADPQKRIDRGSFARKKVEEFFNWDRTAAEIFDFVSKESAVCAE